MSNNVDANNNPSNFMILEVGKKFPGQYPQLEHVQFDITDSGAILLCFYDRPTQQEIFEFKSNTKFEIRFTTFYDIIMITAKMGSLPWIDAPYNPHLSKHLTNPLTISDGTEGLGVLISLIDCNTGIINTLRLVGLANNFTKEFYKAINIEAGKPFNVIEYDNHLREIYNKYSTKDIVKMSKFYCKINQE